MKLSILSLKSVNEKKLSINKNDEDDDAAADDEDDDELSIVLSVIVSRSFPIGISASAVFFFMAFLVVVVLLKDVDNEVAYICLVDIVLLVVSDFIGITPFITSSRGEEEVFER